MSLPDNRRRSSAASSEFCGSGRKLSLPAAYGTRYLALADPAGLSTEITVAPSWARREPHTATAPRPPISATMTPSSAFAVAIHFPRAIRCCHLTLFQLRHNVILIYLWPEAISRLRGVDNTGVGACAEPHLNSDHCAASFLEGRRAGAIARPPTPERKQH